MFDHQSGYYGKRNLESNHSELNSQSRFMLAFCHDFYSSIYRQEKLLEIGGGGIIYSLISARAKLDEIIYAESNLWSRNAVRRWLDGERKSHDWAPFFDLVQMLEGKRTPVAKMIEELKSKVQSVLGCDTLAPRCALPNEVGEKFDVVSSHFCPQDIYENQVQFESGLRNICSLVTPGGYLVISLLDQSAFSLPKSSEPLRISPKRMRELLNSNKFAVIMERHSGSQVNGIQGVQMEPGVESPMVVRNADIVCVAARKCN